MQQQTENSLLLLHYSKAVMFRSEFPNGKRRVDARCGVECKEKRLLH